MKKKNGKGNKFKHSKKTELEFAIEQLKYYARNYIRSAMQIVSYAVPQLVNDARGSSSKLCHAFHLLEQMAVETEKLAAKLQSQLSNALTKEDNR